MKLGNFKQWDPTYMGKGLGGGSKLDEEVFNEFFNQRELLGELAKGIKSLTNNETISSEIRGMDEDEESNDRKEGKVLYKYHRYRERNSKVIEDKKKQFIKEKRI